MTAPAGWHPDPYGRHQLRYWDGTRWTEHVADDGRQSTDPLEPPPTTTGVAGLGADPSTVVDNAAASGAPADTTTDADTAGADTTSSSALAGDTPQPADTTTGADTTAAMPGDIEGEQTSPPGPPPGPVGFEPPDPRSTVVLDPGTWTPPSTQPSAPVAPTPGSGASPPTPPGTAPPAAPQAGWPPPGTAPTPPPGAAPPGTPPGSPPWAPPPGVPPSPPATGGGQRTLLIIVVALVVVVGGFLLFRALSGDGGGGGIPGARDPRDAIPEFGSDATLDRLAERCADGDLASCDDLFLRAPTGSGYEDYGDTCGFRNEPGPFCTVIYGDR